MDLNTAEDKVRPCQFTPENDEKLEAASVSVRDNTKSNMAIEENKSQTGMSARYKQNISEPSEKIIKEPSRKFTNNTVTLPDFLTRKQE